MAERLPLERDVPATLVAWSSREWGALTEIAGRQGVTPEAVVRAFVQRGLASAPVVERRPRALAVVVTDGAGVRLCPVCKVNPLVKKNPHGPGRYPAACGACREGA